MQVAEEFDRGNHGTAERWMRAAGRPVSCRAAGFAVAIAGWSIATTKHAKPRYLLVTENLGCGA